MAIEVISNILEEHQICASAVCQSYPSSSDYFSVPNFDSRFPWLEKGKVDHLTLRDGIIIPRAEFSSAANAEETLEIVVNAQATFDISSGAPYFTERHS
jgi:hypothetical protein